MEARLRGHELHVPAHFDAKVLSALGRLQGAGEMTIRQVSIRLQRVGAAPIQRHLLAPLLSDAWNLRHNLRLVDALYVTLANRLDALIVTTDAGLAAATLPRSSLPPPTRQLLETTMSCTQPMVRYASRPDDRR